MTAQLFLSAMHGQAGIASVTFRYPAAIVTQKAGGVAASISEQQHLLVVRQSLSASFNKGCR